MAYKKTSTNTPDTTPDPVPTKGQVALNMATTLSTFTEWTMDLGNKLSSPFTISTTTPASPEPKANPTQTSTVISDSSTITSIT